MIVSILTAIFLLILIMVFSSTITLFPDFKMYKKVYKELPNKTFYINRTQVYDVNKESRIPMNDWFVWFLDDNHFCLGKNYYLHNDWITFFSPYSFYWLKKYQKFFKTININKLEKF